MKKSTIVCIALIMATMSLSAQPILRGTGFGTMKGKPITLDYTNVSISVPSALGVPTAGANQVFDYSNRFHSSTVDTYILTPQSLSTITEATHADLNFSDDISGTTALTYYDQLLKIDTAGVALVGWRVEPLIMSLAAITGSAADSLVIKEQFVRFSTPIFIQRFPMTAGRLINSGDNTQLEYSGTISVAAFGLNKAPFVRRLIQSQRDSVIGWGVLKRTNLLQNNLLVTDSILLTQRTVTLRDSFFLNGAPAPQTLLSALGATQGRVVSFARTNSYKQNRPFSIFTVRYNPSAPTVATSALYEWAAPVVSSTREALPEAKWSFFPNPVTNHTININYTSLKPVNMTVVDMLGRTVQQSILPENAYDAPVTVPLNSTLARGTYIMHLQNGEFQKTLKISVIAEN